MEGQQQNRGRWKIHTPIAEETMSALELELRDGKTARGRNGGGGRRTSDKMDAVEEGEESEMNMTSRANGTVEENEPPASPFVGYVHNKASKLRHKNSFVKAEEDGSNFQHTHLTRSSSVMSMNNAYGLNSSASNFNFAGQQQQQRRNSIAAIEGIARRRSSASARAEMRRNSTAGFENVKHEGVGERYVISPSYRKSL
jgi:hypothetical protein